MYHLWQRRPTNYLLPFHKGSESWNIFWIVPPVWKSANGIYPHSRQNWERRKKITSSRPSLLFFAVIRLLFLRGTGWEFHFSSETPREKNAILACGAQRSATQNISLLLMMTSLLQRFSFGFTRSSAAERVNVAWSKILWPRIVNNQQKFMTSVTTRADINFNTLFLMWRSGMWVIMGMREFWPKSRDFSLLFLKMVFL